MVQISASILNCKHTRIGEAVKKAQEGGAAYVHVDVMDGVYCKNFTFGPGMVEAIKAECSLPIEVHMELYDVENILPMFINTGVDMITIQLDACPNPLHALRVIRKHGIKAGIAIGPSYTIERLPYLLHCIDSLTLMSVEPGYGGQPFEPSVYDKIRTAKKYMNQMEIKALIQVDGGVNAETAPKLIEAGADVLIVGTYIFNSEDISQRIRLLKNKLIQEV